MNNKKGENMTNLKKVGLTALAGSLVAVSAAQAGEIAVSGSANVTYKTGTAENSSKSIGTDKDVTFTGTGELDNGWTFTVSSLTTDALAISSSYTSLTMGSMGTLTFGQDTGGASYKYDEEVPQAYEQTSDSQQNSANVVGNQMDSNMIVYNAPALEIGGATVNVDLEYSPQAADNAANDGGQHTYSETYGKGMGAGVTIAYDALKVGVYGSTIENNTPSPAGQDASADMFDGVWYAKYSFGPVSIGYSESYLDQGVTGSAEATNTAKTIRTAAGIFESNSVSVAFNVNDDLSISYTETEDTYDAQHDSSTAIEDVTQETEALQIAYSMGGMSIKAYNMETTNPGYDEDAGTKSVTEIALGLSF
jgi:outer membrane protein OmpU